MTFGNTIQGESKGNENELPLIIPEGIRYNCQGCGRCCSGWAVGLTDEDYDRVKDVNWGELKEELKGQELFVDRRKEFEAGYSMYPYFTKPRPDGTCPFLFDNLCFIHAARGEDQKPEMCKLFPYTFVPTPSGIFVSVVANSMASVRNLGELLTNQRKMLAEIWQQTVDHERAQGRSTQQISDVASTISAETLKGVKYDVNLVPGVALTWDEYMHIDTRLIELINSQEHKNIFDTLIAAAELLLEALKIKNKGENLAQLSERAVSPETVDRYKQEPPTTFENLLFNLQCFRSFEWPLLRKQYAANWAAANKSPLMEPKVLKAGIRSVMGGKIEFPYTGVVSIPAVRKYKVEPFSPEINEFLRRYLYMKVFSKGFCGPSMSGLSVVAGYNNIVANFLTAVIYVKARAMTGKETEVKIADFYEAYFLLDKEVVQVSQLPKDKAQFFDSGFASPRLFSRLLGRMAREIG
ncbi:MAG: YkgJ family cysteine cluster protein [Candidatus Melainabacteria bacterium]|nr:YkgJ family cysteine cluster protein [Candidatus Melainabacteria bacterium]